VLKKIPTQFSSAWPRNRVWCVLSALKIKGPIFFKETIHSYSYIRSYMTLFFRKWAEENICDYFTDDKATANIPTSDWLPQKGYLANSWKLADCGNLDLQIWIRTISICGGHRKKQYMHAHIYQTLEATSKLWEPEGWHVANSMLRTHKY